MSTLAQIRDGIVTTIDAGISGLRIYGRVPASPILPCVIVIPTAADFDVAMGRGSDTWRFDMHVLVSAGSDEVGQRKLDSYVTGGGSSSIRQVVFNARTLGLADTTAHVSEMVAYGLGMEAVEIEHIYATLILVVETSGTG